MRAWIGLLASLLLGACSTIIEGSSQQIAVNTDPPGATCGLYREGVQIATVLTTPGSALIKKSKQHISVLCIKPGYQQAGMTNRSDMAAASFGNIILGGLVGVIIDSSTGADNKYEGSVSIMLKPDAPDIPTSPTALPARFAVPEKTPAAELTPSKAPEPSAPENVPVRP